MMHFSYIHSRIIDDDEVKVITFSVKKRGMDSPGFEPGASALRRRRSTRLSYEPSVLGGAVAI